MHFGKNIKKIRSIKKLSQQAFAEMFGLKRSNIGSYEEERAEPKLEIIIKIAEHFNISVDSLVNREITVNELYNFHLPDEHITNNRDDNKQQFIKGIPLLSSNEVMLKPLARASTESENQINLPGLNDKQIAISVEQNAFEHLPKHFGFNDIVVVQTELELENELNMPGRLFFIKTGKTLGIGEIKRINKNELLLILSDKAPVIIAEKKLDYLLPVVGHISNSPIANQAESDRIRKMELLINDLYNRISESE